MGGGGSWIPPFPPVVMLPLINPPHTTVTSPLPPTFLNEFLFFWQSLKGLARPLAMLGGFGLGPMQIGSFRTQRSRCKFFSPFDRSCHETLGYPGFGGILEPPFGDSGKSYYGPFWPGAPGAWANLVHLHRTPQTKNNKLCVQGTALPPATPVTTHTPRPTAHGGLLYPGALVMVGPRSPLSLLVALSRGG